MIPLTYALRKAKEKYTLGGGEKISHLLFMDELKLYERVKTKSMG